MSRRCAATSHAGWGRWSSTVVGGRRDRPRVPQHDGRGLPADDRDRRDARRTCSTASSAATSARRSAAAARRRCRRSRGSSRARATRAGEIDDLLRDRVPIDLQLLLGGVLLGTLAGVWGGRRCALRPRSFSARVLHVATAFLLSCPPYFLAFMILICSRRRQRRRCSSSRSLSGVTDYAPFSRRPAAVREGDVGAVAAVRAAARGVRAADHREHAARGPAGGLRAHRAREGPPASGVSPTATRSRSSRRRSRR